MNAFEEPNASARNILLHQKHGVLSTVSLEIAGYPFGSVAPYCLDRQGRPVLLISDIAEHTKNIDANPKVSLTVLDHSVADVQAGGRITLVADAVRMEPPEPGSADRYYRYFPNSRGYHQAHSFSFYSLKLVRVRFIGGFGQIHWLEPQHFALANRFTADEEKMIVDHMNEDHQSALQGYLKSYKGMDLAGSEGVEMAGIDSEGFDVRLDGRCFRFEFEQPIGTVQEARENLIKMTKA